MGNRHKSNPKWLWLLGMLTALSVLALLSGHSVGAHFGGALSASTRDGEGPLQTETPSATAALTSTATVRASPTNTPRPTRTPIPTATSCPIQFSDVPPGSAYYDYVRCLACRGFVSGYPDATFRPNSIVTRGQVIKIDTLAGGIVFPIPPERQSFEDVPPGSTYWVYIERAYAYPIADGYPCGGSPNEPCVPPLNRPYFRPNHSTTRGQVTKIINNTAGWLEPVTEQYFEDVPGPPFYDYVGRMAPRGIISGYPCGGAGEPCVPPNNRPYFRPNLNITRGQTSKIVGNTFFPNCQTPSGLK